MFDRERVFIETKLTPLLERVSGLRVVMEHITTKDAVDFVTDGPDNVAASITPQHMLMNRNALFQVTTEAGGWVISNVQSQKYHGLSLAQQR